MLPLLTFAFAPAVAASDLGAWKSLDREIEALQSATTAENDGPRVSGFLRVNYADSDDLFLDFNGNGVQDAGENDLGGFSFDNVRIAVAGRSGDVGYLVSFDFGGLSERANLFDAYVTHDCWENGRFTLGKFRAPFLRSALVSEKDTLFIARTRNGILYSVRDLGLMYGHELGDLHAAVAVQNGVDGTGDENFVTGRIEWRAVGGGAPFTEGAIDAGPDQRLTVGIAASDDAGLDGSGAAFAADVAWTWDRFSAHGEIVDYGDGYTSGILFPGEPRGDTTPWSVTGSWLFLEQWEAAVRYEDFDEDVLAREVWSLGVNHYVAGHDLKWQLNTSYADKPDTDDETIIALGLTLAF